MVRFEEELYQSVRKTYLVGVREQHASRCEYQGESGLRNDPGNDRPRNSERGGLEGDQEIGCAGYRRNLLEKGTSRFRGHRDGSPGWRDDDSRCLERPYESHCEGVFSKYSQEVTCEHTIRMLRHVRRFR